MVFVEGLHHRFDVGILLPRLRHQHHGGVDRRAAGAHEELQRVVEARRIAAARSDRIAHAFGQITERWGLEQGAAHGHPVAIAPQRVDLAVVRQHAERLRQIPPWHRVRGVALVKHGDRAFERGVAQVGEEVAELSTGEESLVHHRAARHRTDVERIGAPGECPVLHLATGEVELPFPCVVVTAGGPSDQDLTDRRHRGARRRSQHLRAHRHIAPAKDGEPVGEEHVGDDRGRVLLCHRLGGEEAHPHRDGGIGRQVHPQARGRQDEEPLRNLCHDARAVGRAVGGRCPPMREPRRGLERERHHFVRTFAALAGNEANAAGIARAVGGAGVLGEQGAAGLVRAHDTGLPVARRAKGGYEKSDGCGVAPRVLPNATTIVRNAD